MLCYMHAIPIFLPTEVLCFVTKVRTNVKMATTVRAMKTADVLWQEFRSYVLCKLLGIERIKLRMFIPPG